MEDLVIRNARVVDGAGGAAFSADVAVNGGSGVRARENNRGGLHVSSFAHHT